jgi:tetratricopeptide (TPR) repeat protein
LVILALPLLGIGPFIWIFLGRLRHDEVDSLLNRRQFSEALRRVDSALVRTPGDGRLLSQRAYASWALGNFEQAALATAQVLASNSRFGLALGVRALMFDVNGDAASAEAQANMYVSEASQDWRAYWVRATVMRDSDKLDAALVDLDTAMRLAQETDQKAVCYAARASVHLQRDNQSALRDADLAVNLAPDVPAGYLIRAIVLERIQNFAQSRQDLLTYSRLVPAEAEAARLLVKEVAAGLPYTEQLAARIRFATQHQPREAAIPDR